MAVSEMEIFRSRESGLNTGMVPVRYRRRRKKHSRNFTIFRSIRQFCPAVQWVNTFFPIHVCIILPIRNTVDYYTIKKFIIFSLLVFSSGLNPSPFRKLDPDPTWYRIHDKFVFSGVVDPDPQWFASSGSGSGMRIRIRNQEHWSWPFKPFFAFVGTFFALLATVPYFKYFFHVIFQHFVTSKSGQDSDPGPDPHWFGALDPKNHHWDIKKLVPDPHSQYWFWLRTSEVTFSLTLRWCWGPRGSWRRCCTACTAGTAGGSCELRPSWCPCKIPGRFIPDPGSWFLSIRIPDQKTATKITKLKNILILNWWIKKFRRMYKELSFYPKNCH